MILSSQITISLLYFPCVRFIWDLRFGELLMKITQSTSIVHTRIQHQTVCEIIHPCDTCTTIVYSFLFLGDLELQVQCTVCP